MPVVVVVDGCSCDSGVVKCVAVSRLKAGLSGLLARVRAGESVLVTDRGRIVARIDPADPRDDDRLVVSHLVVHGLASRPSAPLPADFFRTRRVRDPDALVRKALLAERAR